MDSSMMRTTLAEVKALSSILEQDIERLANGTKAAAPTARKTASNITKACKKIREDVLSFQKALPTNKRVKKVENGAFELNTAAEVKQAIDEIGPVEVPPIDEVPPPPKLVRTKRQYTRKPK